MGHAKPTTVDPDVVRIPDGSRLRGLMIAGFIVAAWVKRVIVDQGYKYETLDDTLFVFAGSLAKYAVIAATIIAVLSRFGVETTSFVAVIGAAGLAIGLALQGTLSNVAAGVMLMIFRPFRLEQYIEAGGHAGTVKEINLFTTELATPDNVQIIVRCAFAAGCCSEVERSRRAWGWRFVGPIQFWPQDQRNGGRRDRPVPDPSSRRTGRSER